MNRQMCNRLIGKNLLEWDFPVAGKSFPNVLTKQSIQYKYDDYSIIRLIFSHSDHCAINISKKKDSKNFLKIIEKKLKIAGKSIP